VLQVGSEGYGFLQSAGGAGALAGTLVVAALAHNSKRGWQAIAGGAGYGLLLMAFSVSTSYPLSLAIMVVMGMAGQFYQTSINTSLQLLLPDEYRGRVMGVYGLTWSLTPLGGTFGGFVAELAGAPFAIGFGGFLVAMMAFSVALLVPRVRRLT
jgi:MFS family permease